MDRRTEKTMTEETEQPGNSISSVARKYVVHLSEMKNLRKRISELDLLLGKKTMEVENIAGCLGDCP